MRYFNTAGPIRPDKHYNVDPLTRIDLPEILSLIEQEKYFVLHAPRQTGKTSALFALRDKLNREGRYHCVYVNVEDAQAARGNYEKGVEAVLGCFFRTLTFGHSELLDKFPSIRRTLEAVGAANALGFSLSSFVSALDRPLVLLMDEIDALVGDTLISVLRQIRSGYPSRPASFPQSIVLCGVRDVRDYRIHSEAGNEIITGGSAFNIKAESIRIGDFSPEEIRALLGRHTEETDQIFEEPVFGYVWEQSEGQPWLVNALAYEACWKLVKDRTKPVTLADIQQARENLILRRDTHIDALVDKLREPRVRRVVEPILLGDETLDEVEESDLMYVRDLGLIKKMGNWVVSNAIYREIIPREMVFAKQTMMVQELAWYLDPGSSSPRLRMNRLLEAFQIFFREHSESWVERFDYKEAGPHLLLMAFLQRVLNGGGRIFREYGLGRRRIDLLVEYGLDRFAIELKLYKDGKTRDEGLAQLGDYMDKAGATEGHLVIFDRRPGRTWDEKIFVEKVESADNADSIVGGNSDGRAARSSGGTAKGRCVTVWGM